MLGRHPKDFDIATNARPEQIKKLFRNCLLIGRRFRLAHIHFGRDIIEVATFRAAEASKYSKHRYTAEHGMLLRDNVYGTFAEDAERRDLTINALYYNIADFSVVDFWNGLQDLQNKIIRIIGNPRGRYQEDPVRLLRVIRFAGKLDFAIEKNTEAPITELAPLLEHVPAARLFDEALKLFHGGKAFSTLALLRKYQLFEQLFPQVSQCLAEQPKAETLITLACQNTDARIQENKTVSPGFLFACLLWYPMQKLFSEMLREGLPSTLARDKAAQTVISKQVKKITIPRRFTIAVREIWNLQHPLEQRNPKQIMRLLSHPRFRAAYDFLVLRADANESVKIQANWWTQLYEAEKSVQEGMISELPKLKKRRRKRFK